MNTLIHMPVFWGIVFFLMIVALVFLLLPLYRKPVSKGKRLFLVIFTSTWLLIVPLLYWQWGAVQRLEDSVALAKISQTLERVTKNPNPTKETMAKTFATLENEIGFSALALAQLGSIYSQLGLYDKAIAVYAKAMKIDGDPEYRVQWVYAHSLKNQGKLPSDVRHEAEKLVQASSRKEIINLLAIDDYFQGRFEQASQGWTFLLANDSELTGERRTMMENALAKARQHASY